VELLRECRKSMPMCHGPLETIAFKSLPFALKIRISSPPEPRNLVRTSPVLDILVSESIGPFIDLSSVFGPPRNIRVRTRNANLSECRSGSTSMGTNASLRHKDSKSF